MLPSVKQVLERTLELLSGRARWIKGVYVADIKGVDVPGYIPDAHACYCLAGGIRHVIAPAVQGMMPILNGSQLDLYADCIKAIGFNGEGSLTMWNDVKRRTKAQVLKRLREGIENAV